MAASRGARNVGVPDGIRVQKVKTIDCVNGAVGMQVDRRNTIETKRRQGRAIKNCKCLDRYESSEIFRVRAFFGNFCVLHNWKVKECGPRASIYTPNEVIVNAFTSINQDKFQIKAFIKYFFVNK